jgi:histidinol dehydrogenase
MKIYTLEEAKNTLLKRRPIAMQDVSEKTLEGIKTIFGEALSPALAVERILADVRARGDEALVEWNTRLDKRPNAEMRVPASEIQQALESLPRDQKQALRSAADRVRAFHEKQPALSWVDQSMDAHSANSCGPSAGSAYTSPAARPPCPPRC